MDYIEIIGLSAAFFTTIANIPQAVKVIRTREVKSLSAPTYSMLFLGMVIWVIYGAIRNDLPIILANSIAGSLCGIILIMKLLCQDEPHNSEKI
ncbi:SemiSWEET transporter [Flavobacterium sp. DG1-102-2]|uniref:SemiSWEET family sugar transporter n=1 Tax=Flavobacterium sp. DG1-102-2 TaxID=3081663 RepID=UPI00294A365D|nr:SemiSWEET transporter [Flavobacterium sp. DG1-102-2]MDV6168772.1 SemiSWEET transporter [Flavobacterium sp. DG1-102-2]